VFYRRKPTVFDYSLFISKVKVTRLEFYAPVCQSRSTIWKTFAVSHMSQYLFGMVVVICRW